MELSMELSMELTLSKARLAAGLAEVLPARARLGWLGLGCPWLIYSGLALSAHPKPHPPLAAPVLLMTFLCICALGVVFPYTVPLYPCP